jgi:hypothetical protein
MAGMTDLLTRPRPVLDAPPAPAPPRPAALSAALGAGWAAAVCLAGCVAVSVLAWLLGSTGSATGALEVGASAWLLAHGSPLVLSTGTVSMVPLGITALAALLLYRSGRWAALSSAVTGRRAACVTAGTLTGCYAALAVVVAVAAASAQARPDPLRALLGSALLAAAGGGLGVLRGAGLSPQLAAWVPVQLRAAGRGAVGGVLAMLVLSALLLAGSLVSHLGLAQEITASLDTGPAGAVLLALVSLLLIPNAVLFTGAYALGPGFTLGVDTLMTPGQVDVGRLPSLPLLAALPTAGPPPAWGSALVLVAVLAGCAAAAVALRRHPVEGLVARAVRGGLAGVAAGVAFGLLTALAGASGPGRLVDVGPQTWPCVLVAAVGLGLGGLLGGSASALPLGAVAGQWRAGLAQRWPDGLRWRRGSAGR